MAAALLVKRRNTDKPVYADLTEQETISVVAGDGKGGGLDACFFAG